MLLKGAYVFLHDTLSRPSPASLQDHHTVTARDSFYRVFTAMFDFLENRFAGPAMGHGGYKRSAIALLRTIHAIPHNVPLCMLYYEE